MSAVRIDPKRFEDADFTLEYFRNTGFDSNEMNRRLIEDQVQVNLLVVLGKTLQALDSEKNKAKGEASPTKTDVDMINQQREANRKAQENAPANSEVQTATSVTTNPVNLTEQDTTLTNADVETNKQTSTSNPETAKESNNTNDIDI